MDKHTQHAPSAQTRATLTRRGVVLRAMQPAARPLELSDDRFHFVWSPQRRRPRARHATREAAEAEALRLAESNPGIRFDVFEAVRVTKVLK